MKQKDHKALAYYLINNVGDRQLWSKAWHRRFFLLGCIGPDYVPFTYLRGFRKSHAMLGHHAAFSAKHIGKRIRKLQKRGVHRVRDCFALGTLMHYLADSFTFPHTEAFLGDMRAHRAYEKALHGYFSGYLKQTSAQPVLLPPVGEELSLFLQKGRERYVGGEMGCRHDCKQIVYACSGVFHTLCRRG